jgi:hypothetical protein
MGRCGCGDESVPKRSAKRLPPCIELDCDALPSRGCRMKAGDNIGGRNSSEGAWRRTPYHFIGRNMMSSQSVAGMKKRACRSRDLSQHLHLFRQLRRARAESSQVKSSRRARGPCLLLQFDTYPGRDTGVSRDTHMIHFLHFLHFLANCDPECARRNTCPRRGAYWHRGFYITGCSPKPFRSHGPASTAYSYRGSGRQLL